MPVELGFLEECQPWQVESRLFPSKTGGKPAWLSLENIPTGEQLKCGKCLQPMIFLCQVYAPYDDLETNEHNFHRTLFVFVCKNAQCCERNDSSNMAVYRSCLPRKNKFYPLEPPEDRPDPSFRLNNIVKVCNFCGCAAEKSCSQCKLARYCCKEHQVKDWKEKHKKECKSGVLSEGLSELLFAEWEIVTEPECLEQKEVNIDEELMKYEQLKKEGKSGTLDEVSEEDLDSHASIEKDKSFARFRKRISDNPEQVIRYDKGGKPLWIADKPVPEKIPNCEYCNGARQFELQIMPQMLTLLKESNLDWGVIAIYTCEKSCPGEDINGYKKEYVFKQDVALNNV